MMYANEESGEAEAEGVTVSSRLFLLVILGFVMVFVGVILIVVAAALSGGGAASVGAVIFIGPFPIVIGAGPDMSFLIVVGIVLAVLSIVVFVVMRRRVGSLGF